MARPQATVEHSAAAAFEAAWDAFFRSVRRARSRAARETGTGPGLTMSQYFLLVALLDADELTVGELAAAADIAQPTATRALEALERDGIVTRAPASHDRRAVAVRLTPAGRRLMRRRREAVSAKRRAIFEALSPEEQASGAVLLQRLAEAVDEL